MNVYEQMTLMIEAGPGAGDAYPLGADPLTVGRARDNTIFVNDSRISRYHARITAIPGGVAIEDLGSTNGTFINGVLVRGEQQAGSQDVIELGDCIKLRVILPVPRREAHTPPPPTVIAGSRPAIEKTWPQQGPGGTVLTPASSYNEPPPVQAPWQDQGPGGTVWIAQSEPAPPYSAPPADYQPYQEPAARKKPTSVYIGVGCLVLLLCLCLAVAISIWFAPTEFWQAIGML